MIHYRYSPYNNTASNTQRGVGLVEVLVALLLLAVAALGYTALQAKALKSTDESLMRTQALTILRDTAEKIRTNGLGSTYELTVTAADGTTTKTKEQILNYYQTIINQDGELKEPSLRCLPKEIKKPITYCTPTQMADEDVYLIKTQAEKIGLNVGMTVCPGTANGAKTKCLVAAWNNTKPKLGDGATDCMNDTGTYRFNADCVYMEAY